VCCSPEEGVRLFDSSGNEYGLGIEMIPGDCAVLQSGDLALVSQSPSGAVISVYSVEGVLQRKIGEHILGSAWGLHVDPDGAIWVSDRDHDATPFQGVHQFLADGTHVRSLDLGHWMGDLFIDPSSGTLWTISVLDRYVRQFDASSGALLSEFPTELTSSGSGLALAMDGSLLVSSWSSPDVLRYTSSGTLVERLHIEEAGPGGVLFMAVYRGSGGPSIGAEHSAAKPNSTGLPARLEATGDVQVPFNHARLHATDLPPSQLAMFVNAPARGPATTPPGSQGDLCLSGPIGRHVAEAGLSSAAGELDLVLDLEALPIPGGSAAILPGETWHWQCWYRDQNPLPTANFTNALAILFEPVKLPSD